MNPSTASNRKVATIAALAIVLSAALARLVEAHSIPVCFFRAATGRLCLFCGMTHSLASLSHGDVRSATDANPLWWLILPMFGLTFAMIVTGRGRLGWWGIAFVIAGTLVRALVLP